MRIGFDAKRYFLNRTGLGNYARNTISALQTYFPENRYFLYTPGLGKDPNPLGAHTEVRTPALCTGRIGSAVWRFFYLPRRIQKDGLDLYHGLSHELPAGITKTGCRTAVTMHDLIFMRLPELYTRIDARIYRLKYSTACKAADLVLAISKSTKDDLQEFFSVPEEKIRVVYQSCDPVFFDSRPKQDLERVRLKYRLPREYILYVGSLAPRKNIHNLIRGLGLMGPEDAPFLVLVGRGKKEYVQGAVQIAAKSGLKNRVLHLPHVPTMDLPALYQAARVFVYPSVYEGFGIPVLEALASRTPVITADNSCLREAGGPGSRYVNPESAEEIGQAVHEILGDKELSQDMIRKGERHARGFTPEKRARELMDTYRELVR
ncbi:MAG: glycosyltransferase family 4 protein [Desulfonatronovibrionaceae bacterium]